MDTAKLLEFIGNHPFLFTAAGVLLILLIGNELRRLFRPFREVAPVEVVRLMNAGARVIDLRGVEAYRKGHLPEARNIPAAELPGKLDTLAKDAETPVVVYCDAGVSSTGAAGRLSKAGIREVYSMKGGLAAWQRDSLPLSKQ